MGISRRPDALGISPSDRIETYRDQWGIGPAVHPAWSREDLAVRGERRPREDGWRTPTATTNKGK